MRRTARLATGVAVCGIVGSVGAPTAFAQTVEQCSVYAEACVESEVIENKQVSDDGAVAESSQGSGTVSNNSSTPATLPFTGGEVLLLGLVGAGALAGGTALVVAGRRRGVTAA